MFLGLNYFFYVCYLRDIELCSTELLKFIKLFEIILKLLPNYEYPFINLLIFYTA